MRMIYSDSLNEMVVAGFSMKLKSGGTTHYTWNDQDCIYWNDDTDEKFYMEVPKNAIIDK